MSEATQKREAQGRRQSPMSPRGQTRRSSCLGMSASPPTPDVSLRGNELTLRAIIGSSGARPASYDAS